MSEIIRSQLSKTGKILLWLSVAFIIAVYGSVMYLWPNDAWNNRNILVLMLFMLPILLYSFVDSYKLRIIVTDDHLERIGIRQKHIRFADVTSVLVEPRTMTIKDVDTSIKFDFTVSGFPEIMREVCKRIKSNNSIKVSGDKKLLLELFSIRRK